MNQKSEIRDCQRERRKRRCHRHVGERSCERTLGSANAREANLCEMRERAPKALKSRPM